MANGKGRKNRKTRNPSATTTTSAPSKQAYVPPQPTRRLLSPENDDRPTTPEGSSDDMNQNAGETDSLQIPPLTATSPETNPGCPPPMEGDPFGPEIPQGGNQGPTPSTRTLTKRKRTELSHSDPAPPPTPSRSYLTPPTQGDPQTPSSFSDLQVENFSSGANSPNLGFRPHPDVFMDQDGINPDVDVTGLSGETLLSDLNSEMREGWKGIESPKAIAIPYRATYSEQYKLQTAEKIATAISQTLGGALPTVLAPVQAPNTTSGLTTYRPPWCYLVINLPEDDIDQLISSSFISNQYLGVQILPFRPRPSNYVTSIRGLNWKKTTDATAVEKLIRETIESNTATRRFIHSFIADKNNRIPKDIVKQGLGYDWVVRSVWAYLHILGEEESTSAEFLWRWYIMTPSDEEPHVVSWTNHLENLTFNGVTNGWGSPYTFDRCNGCKSTNHPTPDCPFPKRFPQLNDTNPAQARPTNRGRGRPGRGEKSRGRGWRGRGGGFRNTTTA